MKISLVIYLLGYICGMAFGIALSLLIDFIVNGDDVLRYMKVLEGVDKE